MINEYFINRDTLLIIPSDGKNSKIYDKEDEYLINNKTINIVEESCNYYGSSFKGRCDGSRYILKRDYKLPVIIDEVWEIILVPTSSPNSADCCWICVNNVEDFYEKGNKVVIEFDNKQTYELDISYYVVENQILRGNLLLNKLRKRKIMNKKIG